MKVFKGFLQEYEASQECSSAPTDMRIVRLGDRMKVDVSFTLMIGQAMFVSCYVYAAE